MKILFIADARSPIAINWIDYFIRQGYRTEVISTYPCSTDPLVGVIIHTAALGLNALPRRKSGPGANSTDNPRNPGSNARILSFGLNRLTGLARMYHQYVGGPVSAHRQSRRVGEIILRSSPDLVHAMRIPFEGILAAGAVPAGLPLLISVWGNDFTLFARRNPVIGRQTRRVMQRADALHTDCQRDQRLAAEWGFNAHKPAVVLPGAGGIHTDVFHLGKANSTLRETLNIPDNAPVVINPRGIRSYVRNELFFQAIPQVLEEKPAVIFICSAMRGSPVAEKWIRELEIGANVRLLSSVPQQQMADFYRLAQISVSPSAHDGTPNTLLEAMACGCFPVAGDIESVREWITDGSNGFLFPLDTPESTAQALLRALSNSDLRRQARGYNFMLIQDRADYHHVMPRAEEFYRQVINSKGLQTGTTLIKDVACV